jgi:hypothetical protein
MVEKLEDCEKISNAFSIAIHLIHLELHLYLPFEILYTVNYWVDTFHA